MSSDELSDESLEEISEEKLEEPLEPSIKKKRKIEDPIEDNLVENSKPRYAKRKDKETIEEVTFDKTAHKMSHITLTKEELRDIASEHHTKVRVNAIELFQKCDLYDISIEEKHEMWLFAIQSACVGRRKTVMNRDVQLIIDIWLKCKDFY